MTNFADFKTQIAEWANREDWSDTLVTSFIRMAEQKLNSELRIDRMIQFDNGLIKERSVDLPSDWLEMDLVRMNQENGSDDFIPIKYKPRDEFHRTPDKYAVNYYTIEGRRIIFGGTPDMVDGLNYKITYYGEVPVFADAVPSWVYTKYPSLYLYASLMHSGLHAIGEEGSVVNFKQIVEDDINKLNAAHLRSKASGSRLARSRAKGFG